MLSERCLSCQLSATYLPPASDQAALPSQVLRRLYFTGRQEVIISVGVTTSKVPDVIKGALERHIPMLKFIGTDDAITCEAWNVRACSYRPYIYIYIQSRWRDEHAYTNAGHSEQHSLVMCVLTVCI